jgi:hypothetical protein
MKRIMLQIISEPFLKSQSMMPYPTLFSSFAAAAHPQIDPTLLLSQDLFHALEDATVSLSSDESKRAIASQDWTAASKFDEKGLQGYVSACYWCCKHGESLVWLRIHAKHHKT